MEEFLQDQVEVEQEAWRKFNRSRGIMSRTRRSR
jgi:hypothetical protein